MKPFKFVHAADLHLGSPFKGLSAREPNVAEFLHHAAFLAFDKLVSLCIESKADFLLLAGDIFDTAGRGLKAQLVFREGLGRLRAHGIRVFAVFGNHDPLSGRLCPVDWPENVHFFGAEAVEEVIVEISGGPAVSVSGISYRESAERRNLAKEFRGGTKGLFKIGLLHSNVGREEGYEPYAPCEISDLIRAEIDYWALGHVHERKILHEDPYVVYPGNIQGRSIREQGARGCFFVTVDGLGRVRLDFRPLDAARWTSLALDVGKFESMGRLEDAIFSAVEGLLKGADGRPVICRLALTGRSSICGELRREWGADELMQRIRDRFIKQDPFVLVEGLSIDCMPAIDLERMRKTDDFLGFLLRKADELRGLGGARAVLFEEVLARLFSDRRVKKVVGGLTPDELEGMLKEAEFLCLDMLEGGDR
ncbi:MAG: metallophosphoesterase family protein [Dissulfurimicrobium sp.]|uniref:metallophosphoesterase family protein n=1 Tax=Dissulfurimicrobium sp. TaxID=2022436 RepID=UPI003D11AC29